MLQHNVLDIAINFTPCKIDGPAVAVNFTGCKIDGPDAAVNFTPCKIDGPDVAVSFTGCKIDGDIRALPDLSFFDPNSFPFVSKSSSEHANTEDHRRVRIACLNRSSNGGLELP